MNRWLTCSPILLALILVSSSNALAADTYPPMAEGVSSLGATVCDGYLYTYGGHKGKTHTYSTETVSGRFARLKLDGGAEWEELTGGPILQGMNLATHGGKVYRVGGMTPRNKEGEKADNISSAVCVRFDPSTKKWEEMPSLPEPRSSHDVVTVGDKLVVVGGWQQRGTDPSVWHDTAAILDLSSAKPEWKSVKQPFQRRALTAAAVDGKVVVLGGLTATGGDPGRRVDVFDVKTESWSQGPAFEWSERNGFSPAACSADGRLYMSLSSGEVVALSADGTSWDEVGKLKTRRMVPRLVSVGNGRLLLVGGASMGSNLTTLEAFDLPRKR